MVTPLEQQRRDFKGANRDLYDYIAALEWAKALDHAGDLASGAVDGHGAANRLGAAKSRMLTRADELSGVFL